MRKLRRLFGDIEIGQPFELRGVVWIKKDDGSAEFADSNGGVLKMVRKPIPSYAKVVITVN